MKRHIAFIIVMLLMVSSCASVAKFAQTSSDQKYSDGIYYKPTTKVMAAVSSAETDALIAKTKGSNIFMKSGSVVDTIFIPDNMSASIKFNQNENTTTVSLYDTSWMDDIWFTNNWYYRSPYYFYSPFRHNYLSFYDPLYRYHPFYDSYWNHYSFMYRSMWGYYHDPWYAPWYASWYTPWYSHWHYYYDYGWYYPPFHGGHIHGGGPAIRNRNVVWAPRNATVSTNPRGSSSRGSVISSRGTSSNRAVSTSRVDGSVSGTRRVSGTAASVARRSPSKSGTPVVSGNSSPGRSRGYNIESNPSSRSSADSYSRGSTGSRSTTNRSSSYSPSSRSSMGSSSMGASRSSGGGASRSSGGRGR